MWKVHKSYISVIFRSVMPTFILEIRLVLTIITGNTPKALHLLPPLYQFDLVGSHCVCSHTCTSFYPHSFHSGKKKKSMLTDSCASKICLLSRFHGYHLLWELYGGERMSLKQPVVLWGQFGWLALKCKLKRVSLCSFKVTRAWQCNVKLSSPCLYCVKYGDWQKLLVIV